MYLANDISIEESINVSFFEYSVGSWEKTHHLTGRNCTSVDITEHENCLNHKHFEPLHSDNVSTTASCYNKCSQIFFLLCTICWKLSISFVCRWAFFRVKWQRFEKKYNETFSTASFLNLDDRLVLHICKRADT